MDIRKEKEIYHPMYVAELDNGVVLLVYEDYALGSDGKKYYHIGKEDAYGDLYTVGWSCEADRETILK